MAKSDIRSIARWGSGIIVLCTVLSACGCGAGSVGASSTQLQAETELPTIQAEVLTVEPVVWPAIVRTQGTLAADEVAVVGTKVAGRISLVHVDLGDIVRAGDALATLDEEESRMRVSEAESQLAEARAAVGLQPDDLAEELDQSNAPPVRQEKALWDEVTENLRRARDLQARNAISDAEIERLGAAERVAAARYASSLNSVNEKIALIAVRSAQLELARQRLRESVIRSPFDGRILQRQVAPGEYVPVGHPIATVVRSNLLRYRGTIPERRAQQLSLGQSVTLHIESIPTPRQVQVTRISPMVNELSRALLFEATLDNSDGQLRTGLFAEGEVVLDPDARSLVVPRRAVVEFAGAEKVWKVVAGVARQQEVRTGLRRGDAVQITRGLESGDQILLDGSSGRLARVDPIVKSPTDRAAGQAIPSDTAESPDAASDAAPDTVEQSTETPPQ